MLEPGDHVARRKLRIAEHFADVSDRTARNPRSGQRLEPMGARPFRQPRREERSQLVVACHPIAVRHEPRVARQAVQAGRGAEPPPLLVVADCDDEVAVLLP